MARMTHGINGPFIGKIGTAIGYTVNGNWYMKGLYKKRTTAPTPGELLNQKKFAAAQLWLKPITDYVRVGFKGYHERFQGFGAAKSWLMKNAMQVVDGEIIIDPSLVKISSGDLALPENAQCILQTPGQIHFTWNPSMEDQFRYDQAMILAYDIQKKDFRGSIYSSDRSTGHASIDLCSDPGRYHVYLAFVAADRSRQSDSIYFGDFES
jgi:hypothetical protein